MQRLLVRSRYTSHYMIIPVLGYSSKRTIFVVSRDERNVTSRYHAPAHRVQGDDEHYLRTAGHVP